VSLCPFRAVGVLRFQQDAPPFSLNQEHDFRQYLYASLGKIEQQARYELGPFGPIAVGDELNSSGSTSTAYYICPCVVGVEMSFDGMIGATYYYFTCFGVTWRLPMEGRTWIAQLEVIEVDLTKKRMSKPGSDKMQLP